LGSQKRGPSLKFCDLNNADPITKCSLFQTPFPPPPPPLPSLKRGGGRVPLRPLLVVELKKTRYGKKIFKNKTTDPVEAKLLSPPLRSTSTGSNIKEMGVEAMRVVGEQRCAASA
jgi:hypothetical protein